MDNDDLDALRATGLKVVVVDSVEDLDNFFNSLPPAKVEELHKPVWEDEARRAMQNFVDKVECGMAKSQSSYSWFKKLLVVPSAVAPASVQDDDEDERPQTAVERRLRGMALRLAPKAAPAAVSEPGDAYRYAVTLATTIWERYYKESSPEWKPFGETLGVLTQIDNMTSRLMHPSECPLYAAAPAPDSQGAPKPVAWTDQQMVAFAGFSLYSVSLQHLSIAERLEHFRNRPSDGAQAAGQEDKPNE